MRAENKSKKSLVQFSFLFAGDFKLYLIQSRNGVSDKAPIPMSSAP